MKRIRPKSGPLRLDAVSYDAQRQLILRRDGWRCQAIGSMSGLEIHHQELRSHGGEDSDANLITLCSACHIAKHRGERRNAVRSGSANLGP